MTETIRDPAPRRLFLTGEPGCGKTTVARKAAKLLSLRGLKVGGMVTNEIRERGNRLGFSVEDLTTGERGTLAFSSRGQGPRVGRYVVNIPDLERIGAGSIERAVTDADLIVIDELGPMELHSTRFVTSTDAALNSPKHILATIHKRANHPLILRVKSNPACVILEVTRENREELPGQLAKRIMESK